MKLIDADELKYTIAAWRLVLAFTFGRNDEFVHCLDEVLHIIDSMSEITIKSEQERWLNGE